MENTWPGFDVTVFSARRCYAYKKYDNLSPPVEETSLIHLNLKQMVTFFRDIIQANFLLKTNNEYGSN